MNVLWSFIQELKGSSMGIEMPRHYLGAKEVKQTPGINVYTKPALQTRINIYTKPALRMVGKWILRSEEKVKHIQEGTGNK